MDSYRHATHTFNSVDLCFVSSFDLDCVHDSFLHHAHARVHSFLHRGLVAAKGEGAHEQRSRGAPRDRAAVRKQLIQCQRKSCVISVNNLTGTRRPRSNNNE